MVEQPGLLLLQPDELLFSNVRLGQVLQCIMHSRLCRPAENQLLCDDFTTETQHCTYGSVQAYCQSITISNPSRATVEASLRAGSSARYTLSPTSLVLKPQQSMDVDVRLRVLKYAQRQKGVQLGQRDIFHIKACLLARIFVEFFSVTCCPSP